MLKSTWFHIFTSEVRKQWQGDGVDLGQRVALMTFQVWPLESTVIVWLSAVVQRWQGGSCLFDFIVETFTAGGQSAEGLWPDDMLWSVIKDRAGEWSICSVSLLLSDEDVRADTGTGGPRCWTWTVSDRTLLNIWQIIFSILCTFVIFLITFITLWPDMTSYDLFSVILIWNSIFFESPISSGCLLENIISGSTIF